MELNNELSKKQIAEIETEVKQTALSHLNAKDAATALSNYTKDATIASNGFLYTSRQEFTEDIKAFYVSLKRIDLAEWEETRINVIGKNAATFNAKFRWVSTDTSGQKMNLQGVWSALFVREGECWKIKMRHESFIHLKEQSD